MSTSNVPKAVLAMRQGRHSNLKFDTPVIEGDIEPARATSTLTFALGLPRLPETSYPRSLVSAKCYGECFVANGRSDGLMQSHCKRINQRPERKMLHPGFDVSQTVVAV